MAAEFGSVSLKMAGSLVLILGLIITLFYILKRLRWGALSCGGHSEMRLIRTLSLAPKRSIALIEICDQWLVVGIGTESVTLISRFDPPPGYGLPDESNPKDGRSFYSLLQNKGFFHRGRKMETSQ